MCLLGAKGDFTNATGHGVLQYMYHLSEELQRMKPRGISIERKECRPFPMLHGAFTVAAGSVLQDFSMYDIVHLLDIRPFIRVRQGKAVSITTVHDFRPLTSMELDADRYSGVRGTADLRLVRGPAIRAALGSDFLIANSTQTRDEAVQLGFDKRRIFVTNLGIEESYTRKRTKQRKGQKFKIGYIGGIAKAKNVAFAVMAFRMTKAKDSVMEVWGAQAGADYQALVDARGGDRRVRFMGFLQENEKVHTYDSFDLFVYPSLYEGFGIPIVEAQSRGLPVIIYKEGRIPKEVRKYCIEARDVHHMAQIMEDIKENGYNNKERKRAMVYARGFTWERMARQTVDTYRKAYATT